MSKQLSSSKDFNVSIYEKHHKRKVDKPSGTALKIAEDILSNSSLTEWTLNDEKNKLKINCDRKGEEKGFHEVVYESDIDSISISAAITLFSQRALSYNDAFLESTVCFSNIEKPFIRLVKPQSNVLND